MNRLSELESNNKMETEMDFKGNLNDKVFVKHIGLNNVNIKLEEYSATWIESKNTVKIVKPIKNGEAFDITVLIAEKILKNVPEQNKKYVQKQLDQLEKNFMNYLYYWNEKYYRNGFVDVIELLEI